VRSPILLCVLCLGCTFRSIDVGDFAGELSDTLDKIYTKYDVQKPRHLVPFDSRGRQITISFPETSDIEPDSHSIQSHSILQRRL
jgi:hypothetical protein